MKDEHREIIGRVEEIRHQLRLNKSRFSTTIGMKPQTYNNFIGRQGSKPSIELIADVVKEFSVNPLWLMFGHGQPFLPRDWAADAALPHPGAEPAVPLSLAQRVEVLESIVLRPAPLPEVIPEVTPRQAVA